MTLSYIPSDTNAEGILKAVASGVLPDGKPVVVNTDGTVSVVAGTSVSDAIGSPVVFDSGDAFEIGICFDSNSQKIVIVYRDGNNSNYGTAIVGTVSGTSISFGTPVVYNSATTTQNTTAFDSSNAKVVVGYTDNGNSSYGTAIVGTVSGASISFGSEVVFSSSNTGYLVSIYDSGNEKIIFSYSNAGSSDSITSIVGTVSGTSISFGTAADTGQDGYYTANVYDPDTGKFVLVYRDAGSGREGKAIVGTVSSTSISYGSPVTFQSSEVAEMDATYDTSNNKVVIVYDNKANSVGSAIVGTVSGTNISFGSSANFETGGRPGYPKAAYDESAQKVAIFYEDTANNEYGTYVPATVSGTSISFGSTAVYQAGTTSSQAIVYASNLQKFVGAYQDQNNGGKSVVIQNAGTIYNLTSENYIGMSSGVVDVTGTAGGTGSETVFEQATSRYVASAYDTNTNRVVIAYADNGNSQYGTAIVGTVSGTSISFGSPVVFETAEVQNVSVVFDSNSNKIVIAYADEGNSSHGTAIVGTVSGTAISFGSAVVFEAANSGSIVATFDSNSNKAVIAYEDKDNSDYGTAIVGTVSGTSISFGTAVVFEQAEVSGNSIKVAFDSSSNKIVIVYRDSGNSSYGTAIVGTVSGTGISFGTAVVFNAATTNSNGVPIIDTDNNKVIVSYKDSGNSHYGTARVGTVSGTGISFGTAVVFNSGNTELYAGQVYHPNIQRAVIGYRDNGDSGKYNVGTISGTDISFTGEVAFNSGRADNLSLIYDPDSENLVMSFEDYANSSYGTSLVFTPSTLAINRGQVASGSQAITNIIGSVSSIQTGLTAGQSYFVQTDGTIGLTADDPSVFAGTAISATKLIVKT